MRTQDFTLSPEQVAEFHRDGFLRVERLTDIEEIEAFRGVYESVLAEPRQNIGGQVVEAVTSPATHPHLYETTFVRNARAAAGAILGEDPESLPVVSQLLYKPPGSTQPIPWHQDEAYWEPGLRFQGVAVWMPLDDVTIESGCMHFAPGTHRSLLTHEPDPSVEGLRRIPDIGVEPVACPLPAGGATFHDFRTAHYTGPNLTNRPRRAIVNRFYGGPDKHVFAQMQTTA